MVVFSMVQYGCIQYGSVWLYIELDGQSGGFFIHFFVNSFVGRFRPSVGT